MNAQVTLWYVIFNIKVEQGCSLQYLFIMFETYKLVAADDVEKQVR